MHPVKINGLVLLFTSYCFGVQVAQSELDVDTVKAILGEYRISNADITLRHDATTEELIDVIEGNRVYIPCIYVLNKIDQISIEVRIYIPCIV